MDFFRESPDPEKMFRNFLARSLWYNELIKKEAKEYQMTVLAQNGDASVDELCQKVLNESGGC